MEQELININLNNLKEENIKRRKFLKNIKLELDSVVSLIRKNILHITKMDGK